MESHKKTGTTCCGKPSCVYDIRAMSEGAKTEAPKELRERNMSLDNVRNYLLGFRRISEVDILVQKMQISMVPWKIGIPELCICVKGLSQVSQVFYFGISFRCTFNG